MSDFNCNSLAQLQPTPFIPSWRQSTSNQAGFSYVQHLGEPQLLLHLPAGHPDLGTGLSTP